MEKKIKFTKQYNLLNDKELKDKKAIIFGCGSIGSQLAISMAKIGFKDFCLVDFDIVEGDNIPAQFFKESQIEKLKVDSVEQNLIEHIGNDLTIKKVNKKLETKDDILKNIELNEDAFYFLCFDNIEGRKLIFDTLKMEDEPLHIFDLRIGKFQYEIRYADLRSIELLKKLEQSYSLESYTDLTCYEKCLWGVNQIICAKTLSMVLRILKANYMPKYSKIVGNFLDTEVNLLEEIEYE